MENREIKPYVYTNLIGTIKIRRRREQKPKEISKEFKGEDNGHCIQIWFVQTMAVENKNSSRKRRLKLEDNEEQSH